MERLKRINIVIIGVGISSFGLAHGAVTFSGTTGNVTLTISSEYSFTTDVDPGPAGTSFAIVFPGVYSAAQDQAISNFNYDTADAPFTLSGVTTSTSVAGFSFITGTTQSVINDLTPHDFLLGAGFYTPTGGDPTVGAVVTLQPGTYHFPIAGLEVPDVAPTTFFLVSTGVIRVGAAGGTIPEPTPAVMLAAFLGVGCCRRFRRNVT